MIPFNRAVYLPKAKEYVGETLESSKIAGDGKYTRLCTRWMEERFCAAKILLTTSCTADSVRIAQEVKGIRHICAGLMKGEKGKKLVSKTLAIGPEDVEAFKHLIELGIEVESYSTPDDIAVPITKYLG